MFLANITIPRLAELMDEDPKYRGLTVLLSLRSF